jgi:hypothetical protein
MEDTTGASGPYRAVQHARRSSFSKADGSGATGAEPSSGDTRLARAFSTTCLNPKRAARRDGLGVGVDRPEVGVPAPSRGGGTKEARDEEEACEGRTCDLNCSHRCFDGVKGTVWSTVDVDWEDDIGGGRFKRNFDDLTGAASAGRMDDFGRKSKSDGVLRPE